MLRQLNEACIELSNPTLNDLLKEAVMKVVVGVGRYVVVTAGGFGAGAAEVHHCDFASSGSSSCEVVA